MRARRPAQLAGTPPPRLESRIEGVAQQQAVVQTRCAAGADAAAGSEPVKEPIRQASTQQSSSSLTQQPACYGVTPLQLCCGPRGHHRLQVLCWCTAGDFLYTRFFAIGLFRLLELTKAKDPKALEALVKSMNVSIESVNRDLTTYKVSLASPDCAGLHRSACRWRMWHALAAYLHLSAVLWP